MKLTISIKIVSFIGVLEKILFHILSNIIFRYDGNMVITIN